jgi:hypothetical protein
MITTQVTLTGAAAAARKFATIDAKIRGAIGRKAARESMRTPLRVAKSTREFTDDTGKLRKALRISASVRRRGAVISGRVIAPRGARHATPLEYGHRIAVGSSGRTEKGGVLKRRGRQRSLKLGQFYATSAGHVAPRPFLHQTFSATVRTIERDFTSSFIAQVNQAAVLNG